MTPNRVWKHSKLSTWTQDRCAICQVFLSKKQVKYCKKHGRRYNLKNRDKYLIKEREYSTHRNAILHYTNWDYILDRRYLKIPIIDIE